MDKDKAIQISRQKFLTVNNPSELASKIQSFPDVWNSQSQVLMKLQEQMGRQSILDLVTLYILAINENVNTFKVMTEAQVRICTPIVAEKFKLFKPEDLTMFFNLAITGQLGNIPNRIDCSVIMGMVNEYINQRLNAAENQSIKQHQQMGSIDSDRTGMSKLQRVMTHPKIIDLHDPDRQTD